MYDNVNLTELHCHIGSQIFDIDPFVTAAEIMLDFMGKIHDELGIVISELNSAAVLVLCTLRMMNLFLMKTIWKRFQRLLRQRLKNTDFLFRNLY